MESSPEKRDQLKSYKESAKEFFDKFMNLPDEPGEFLTDAKLFELIEKSKTDLVAEKKFLESKRSKYRGAALTAPLAIAEVFLISDEANDIPAKKKNKLLKEIKEVRQGIKSAMESAVVRDKQGEVISEKPAITKKEVDEVIGIIKEVGPYLK